jgi:hypothetical protein
MDTDALCTPEVKAGSPVRAAGTAPGCPMKRVVEELQ